MGDTKEGLFPHAGQLPSTWGMNRSLVKRIGYVRSLRHTAIGTLKTLTVRGNHLFAM
jgi:hypothetical protein